MVLDFRSDTVTLPTASMMAAIAQAKLGDAARGDDPTVNELERLVADMTGKEDALLLPSGAMANLSAVIAHNSHGGEVIVESTSHIYNAEGGGLSVLAGAVPRPVEGSYGRMDPKAVASVVRTEKDLALPSTRLICVENTHNDSGGSPLPLDHLAALSEVAGAAGLPVHMDGARLFNAAAFMDVPLRDICAHADSVWFALCKGLGCPIGAVLSGTGAFMRRARRAARMLGGGMRQAGIIAAPALVALKDPYPQHHEDHRRAAKLARGLAEIDPSLVEVDHVQTNIVNCYAGRVGINADRLRQALAKRGLLVNSKGAKVRFVTHCEIDDEAVTAAIAIVDETLAAMRNAA